MTAKDLYENIPVGGIIINYGANLYFNRSVYIIRGAYVKEQYWKQKVFTNMYRYIVDQCQNEKFFITLNVDKNNTKAM